MKRFDLFESGPDLRIKLRVGTFLGEGSHIPNTNIAPEAIIPVLLSNADGSGRYLRSMKWGVDLYSNHKLWHNARCESVPSSQMGGRAAPR